MYRKNRPAFWPDGGEKFDSRERLVFLAFPFGFCSFLGRRRTGQFPFWSLDFLDLAVDFYKIGSLATHFDHFVGRVAVVLTDEFQVYEIDYLNVGKAD